MSGHNDSMDLDVYAIEPSYVHVVEWHRRDVSRPKRSESSPTQKETIDYWSLIIVAREIYSCRKDLFLEEDVVRVAHNT